MCKQCTKCLVLAYLESFIILYVYRLLTTVLSIFLSFPLFYFLDNLGLFTRAVNVQYILLYIVDLKNTLFTGKKEGNTGWEIV